MRNDFAVATTAATYVGGMGPAASARNLGKEIMAGVAGQLLRGVPLDQVPQRIRDAVASLNETVGAAVAPVAKATTAPAPVTPIGNRTRRTFNPQYTNG